MNKIFRVKNNNGLCAVALAEITAVLISFGEEGAPMQATISLRSGVEIDTELTASEVEALTKEWNAAL